jgi:hypothetical protein
VGKEFDQSGIQGLVMSETSRFTGTFLRLVNNLFIIFLDDIMKMCLFVIVVMNYVSWKFV